MPSRLCFKILCADVVKLLALMTTAGKKHRRNPGISSADASRGKGRSLHRSHVIWNAFADCGLLLYCTGECSKR